MLVQCTSTRIELHKTVSILKILVNKTKSYAEVLKSRQERFYNCFHHRNVTVFSPYYLAECTGSVTANEAKCLFRIFSVPNELKMYGRPTVVTPFAPMPYFVCSLFTHYK